LILALLILIYVSHATFKLVELVYNLRGIVTEPILNLRYYLLKEEKVVIIALAVFTLA